MSSSRVIVSSTSGRLVWGGGLSSIGSDLVPVVSRYVDFLVCKLLEASALIVKDSR